MNRSRDIGGLIDPRIEGGGGDRNSCKRGLAIYLERRGEKVVVFFKKKMVRSG